MYDAGKVIAGLVIFVGVALAPVWANLGGSAVKPEPKIATEERECVAPKDVIRVTHMDLLDEWRDRVVREGERSALTATGRTVTMSLTGTCMSCHANKAEFCDSCHNYLAVAPHCWDCHTAPEKGGLS
jgi:hypothetical protein